MSRSFFQELMSSVMTRGRRMVELRKGEQEGQHDVLALAEAIMSEKGEAMGVALSSDLLDCFFGLEEDKKIEFFNYLLTEFGPDTKVLGEEIENYLNNPSEQNASRLHAAAEPRRQELIRRLNRAPNGTSSLVAMRQELLARLSEYDEFMVVDKDFNHLLSSWFNRGFLVLERIDWSSSASILNKIIRYEAVHEIDGWDDLQSRVDVPDRRCYAFFHPVMPDDPLIFVEVALTSGIPDAIAPILSKVRQQITYEEADTAVFYSISNCQAGLKGVSFGNFLIKQVVQELAREIPHLKSFVTLSPVPGFSRYLNDARKDAESPILSPQDRETLSLTDEDGWQEDGDVSEQVKSVLMSIGAHYLLRAKTEKGMPLDPVARFHLGNGAVLAQLNWLGDISSKGIKQSCGLMVNYLYDLSMIEENHENYTKDYAINASSSVSRLLRQSETIKELATIDE